MNIAALESPVRKTTSAVLVAALLVFAGTQVHADIFYYQDASGVYHFTNVAGPGAVPFEIDEPAAKASADVTAKVADGGVRADYDDLIREYSDRYEVEPALVKAVIRAESSFNRMAVSRKGARGLMQLMPHTARRHRVYRLHDPRENIRGGVEHLRLLLKRYRNNLPLAVAAYNAGVHPVDRYRGIPPYQETRTYVSRVLNFRRQYLRDQRLAQF